MRIPPEEVEQTAAMARLALTEAEVGQMAEELGRILAYAARLEEVDVSGVPPLHQPLPRACPLRPDTVGEELSQEAALAVAPVSAEGHFAVPAILGPAGAAGAGSEG
jgi:aspartyl-tRNA(Asn)/glutamyl-tRNA(Gln) amidotransferase subunit C